MTFDATSPLASAPPLTELAPAGPLTVEERRQIVRQAQLIIEQLYVHLPLKRAMHAIDPAQRLRLLDRRLDAYSDRRFHDEMISIFVELRDMHTNYLLPVPYKGRVAALAFRIEAYWDADVRRYLVSSVAPGLDLPPFGPGVEVTHWNGIPIERAVALNGERNGGSNEEARHARGLATMTQRPMAMLAQPEEEWVDVTFAGPGGVRSRRFAWGVLEPQPAPAGGGPSALADPVASALGLDLLVEETRRAQKLVLAPEAMALERALTQTAEAISADRAAGASAMPDVLEFRTVPGVDRELGYLRIRTFMVRDLTAYLEEVLRILDLLPQGGLIIDVRGNGGGIIAAGELLLQLFTPRQIEPENLHFVNSVLTLEAVSRPGSSLEQWRDSIAESIETGAPFSDGLPLSPGYAEWCNAIGQRYYGPVALLTDALCYSTTDIFAAGFQDHGIGSVIGTSGNTGAGGASVWTYGNLMEALPAHVKPLPKEASIRVAIRRTSRVGSRAGDPLEDLGVTPDLIHRMTRRDLLERNVDLIATAAQVLAKGPRRAFAAEVTPTAAGADVVLRTSGIDRVDAYVDGRPRGTHNIAAAEHALSVSAPGGPMRSLELRGFSAGELVARRRFQLGPNS